MKKILMAAAVILALAAPMFAQSTFSDVPRDHWAYDAVSELESLGMVIGYPDGTFAGKRTMTRYEFAVVLARLLPFLGEDAEINVDGFAKKSDLDGYMKKSDYKAPAEVDLSDYATIDAVNKIQALVDEFQPELAALNVDVNVLKADVAALKSRVAALEDEQARIKINGSANFMFQDAISGDVPTVNADGYGPIEKFAKRHQSFYKDVQIDIKGRVNDKINVYTTLVLGDYMNKTNTWEDSYDTWSDITPYYMYAASSDEKWGDVRVGRMPFQLNSYVFKRYKESSYFDIDRLDDGNFAVEGFDYSKSWGAFDIRAFGVRPVYDWNDWQMGWYYGNDSEGLEDQKVSVMLGGQIGVNIKEARLSALYTKMSAENEIPFLTDKTQYYGASLYVPFGQFYVDGSWYQMKPNKGYDKASVWDAKLGFANDKLDFAAGYKQVKEGWYGFSVLDKIFANYWADNYKGFYANAGYNFTDAFRVYADFKSYKAKDKDYYSDFENTKYLKGGISWDITALDNIFAEYEQAKYKYDYAGNYKDTAINVGWNRKVGTNAKVKVMYQFLKATDPIADKSKSHLVSGQLSVNF